MTFAEDAAIGHRVVLLRPGQGPGRLRTRTADVLLATLAGELEISRDRRPPTSLFWGQVVVLSRGEVWSVQARFEPARLLVVACPAGPEKVVAALCADPPLPPRLRLGIALDAGVELIL